MTYAGFYINLDRSVDRRKKIEDELARNGLAGRYTRFAATDGNALGFLKGVLNDSEIGCFTSHFLLLLENLNSAVPLHVVEDDAIFSKVTEDVINQMSETEDFKSYDIVYTDIAMSLPHLNFLMFKRSFDAQVKRNKDGLIENASFTIVDLKEIPFCTTTSLIINPHAIKKLAALYRYELEHGARTPIDLLLYQLCRNGTIRAGCTFPFLTSISPEDAFASTVNTRSDAITMFASDLLRYSFFIGCDMSVCFANAKRVLPQPDDDDSHNQLLKLLVGFVLTQSFGRV